VLLRCTYDLRFPGHREHRFRRNVNTHSGPS
jgi:hypothetical protein